MFSSYFKDNTPKENVATIAFYNLENLFDIFDDPETFDDDFTPTGKKKWTLKRYKNKIKKMSEVIVITTKSARSLKGRAFLLRKKT